MKKIVLASSSPRRYDLLNMLGLEFDVIPAGIDEKMDNFLPYEEQVQELSYAKALSVAERIQYEAVVLGG